MPKNINDNLNLGDILHEWTIQEYERHERGVWWYIFTLSTGLLLVIYGVFSGNFLFALIIVLFAIIMFMQSHIEPRQIPFQITDTGIVVGTKFYTFSEFDNFYIIYNPPEVKTLFLDTKGFLTPTLRVPLLDKNPIEVKNCLREFLSEDFEKEEEPLSDRAARNWRIH